MRKFYPVLFALGAVWALLLAGCGGGGSSTANQEKNPVVRSITPNRGPLTGGTPMTIKGDFFSNKNGVIVRLSAVALTQVHVVDDNTITAVTGDASVASTGAQEQDVFVQVTRADASSIGLYDRSIVPFTYVSPVEGR